MQQYDDTQDTGTTGLLGQGEEVKDMRLKVEGLFLGMLKSAVDARLQSGIEEDWRIAEDAFAGRDPDEATSTDTTAAQRSKRNRSRVVINITEGKTGIASSQLIRRVLPGDVKPWEVEPTPVPEFDEAINGAGGEVPVTLGDGSQAPARDVAKGLKVMLADKAERMGKQIQDWLTDPLIYNGKTAYAELRRCIKDSARLGTGVIKGPFPVVKESRKFSGGQVQRSKSIVPRIKAIAVRNCYPDPSCGDDIHAGGFFIERDYLTARQVRAMKSEPGYVAEDLRIVLEQGPKSFSQWDDRYKDVRAGQVRVDDRHTYEVFYLYAEVSIKELIGCGYEIPTLTMAPPGIEDDQQAAEAIAEQIKAAMVLESVPVVATMINGRVCKVVLNPNEFGGFPYRFMCWSRVEGQPYGKGVPTKIITPQRMVTSATRAMLENAGQSAGPQIVHAASVTSDRMEATRNNIWSFDPSETLDDVRKAFALFNIPSVQEQLFNIIKAAQEWADQLADIPLLMQGIVGGTADTLGGMEMLEANAASPLMDIAKEYDEVVAPVISDLYEWAMQDPNVKDECKGDFQCKAIGASVLIHRDRKALAMQQVVAPMASDPGYGLSKAKVAEQLLRGLEIEPEAVQLSDEEKEAASRQQPPTDPRIEAAQIKAQQDAAREKSRRESEDLDRKSKEALAVMRAQFDKAIADIQLEVQTLESANKQGMDLEKLRAMLATTAMTLRNKRDLFAAEREFAIQDGGGRGL